MDFLVQNWVLLVVAIGSGAMLVWMGRVQGGGAGSVSPAEAVQLMNRDKAVVVDVCSPDEFAAGHVAAARNVPLNELEAKLAGVAKNKALPLILVCAKGVRSRRAVAVAQKLGYERACSLAGGMAAWREAKLPVHKG